MGAQSLVSAGKVERAESRSQNIEHPYVDFRRIGKLNHMKEYEQAVNWKDFLYDVEFLLSKMNAQ
jgi:hypothetical protein